MELCNVAQISLRQNKVQFIIGRKDAEMKFLDTDAIIEKTKSIIKDAKSYVYILSPYL